MENLKHCPFCGGAAKVVLKHGGHSGNPSTILNDYVVGCESCHIFTPSCPSKIWMDDQGVLHVDKNGAVIAAEIWNTRAETDPEENSGGE